MQRLHQLLFIVSLLAFSWLTMMVIHEFGHVVGALITGGHVERVVLHPLRISRTDVAPNPAPLIVVWLGPILGCLIPGVVSLLVPRRFTTARSIALFFAGFCLLANGAYIAFGAFDRVGDCGIMLQNGSPFWTLLFFGAVTIPLGFCLWHQLGSVKQFLVDPSQVDPLVTCTLVAALVSLVTLELMISTI